MQLIVTNNGQIEGKKTKGYISVFDLHIRMRKPIKYFNSIEETKLLSTLKDFLKKAVKLE